MDFLNNFSVLILDESVTRQDLFSHWISGVTTRSISSPHDLQREFDASVAVASLSQAALGEEAEPAIKHILTRNPYCQLVGVLPRSSFVSPFENQFDDILQRPVFKDKFREVIEYRFIAGVYTQLLSEFYDVNGRLVSIERAGESDVGGGDGSRDVLQDRYKRLKRNLNTLQEKLGSDTILDVLQTVEQHSKSLSTPDKDIVEGKETKFRPRRCPSCELPWGVHHRNELGKGYKKLGADVYQCARCDKIVHGLAGEHKVV